MQLLGCKSHFLLTASVGRGNTLIIDVVGSYQFTRFFRQYFGGDTSKFTVFLR